MKRSRKEQKAEYAAKHGLAEVDTLDDDFALRDEVDPYVLKRQQTQRNEERNQHQPDRFGKAQVFVVDKAETCRQHNEESKDVKESHGQTPLSLVNGTGFVLQDLLLLVKKIAAMW